MARSRCVRSAATNRSASAGSTTRGRRRTPRTNGTTLGPRWRCWRVGNPWGTGFAVTPASPRTTRYPYSADTAARRRLIVAADNPAEASVIRTTFSAPARPRR